MNQNLVNIFCCKSLVPSLNFLKLEWSERLMQKDEKISDYFPLLNYLYGRWHHCVLLSVRVQAALLITHIHHFQQLRVFNVLHTQTDSLYFVESLSFASVFSTS